MYTKTYLQNRENKQKPIKCILKPGLEKYEEELSSVGRKTSSQIAETLVCLQDSKKDLQWREFIHSFGWLIEINFR